MSFLTQRPIPVRIPEWGVVFAESRHHPDFRMSRRTDSFHKLLLVKEGELSLLQEGQASRILAADSVAYVPAGTVHQLQDSSPASLLILCLNPNFPECLASCRPVWSELVAALKEPLVPSGVLLQRIETAWRKGIRQQGVEGVYRPLSLQLQAMEIMVTLVRAAHYPRKTDPRMRIRQLLRLMEEEYSEAWDIERAAKMVSMSRRRFSDYFREIAGQPFVEKLTRIRLERAMEFMRSGEYSIAGSGFSAGFNDLSHFYRVFKKHLKKTPGEWLKQQQ